VRNLKDIMTPRPVTLRADDTAATAARTMKERNIGDVLVMRDGQLCGIVTDRDLVLRCMAEGADPDEVELGELCTDDVVTLDADSPIEDAIRRMRDKAIRRIPVVENGKPVGIVSLGDLAVERDEESVLGRISAAPPNN
jgi:CBS domain-containing protein